MKTHKLFTALLAAVFLAGTAFASVGTVYLKNNGDYPGHVWIDGSYQGYVPAGQTRYAISDGFLAPDGHDIGGWAARDKDVQVVIASTDEKGNNWYSEIILSKDIDKDDGRVWFGGPLVLNDADKDNAGKIINERGGNGPVDMLKDAQQAASDKRDDSKTATTDSAASDTSTKAPATPKITWCPMQIATKTVTKSSIFSGKSYTTVYPDKPNLEGDSNFTFSKNGDVYTMRGYQLDGGKYGNIVGEVKDDTIVFKEKYYTYSLKKTDEDHYDLTVSSASTGQILNGTIEDENATPDPEHPFTQTYPQHIILTREPDNQ